MKIQVVVADGTYLSREILCCLLEADPAIEIVGTAHDLASLQQLLSRKKPQMLVLDATLPGMRSSGHIASLLSRQCPTLLVTPMTRRGMEASLQAMERGAIDVVPKLTQTAKDMALLRDALSVRIHAACAAPDAGRVQVNGATPHAATLPAFLQSLREKTRRSLP